MVDEHGTDAVACHGSATDGIDLVWVGGVGVFQDSDRNDGAFIVEYLFAHKLLAECVGSYFGSESGSFAIVAESDAGDGVEVVGECDVGVDFAPERLRIPVVLLVFISPPIEPVTTTFPLFINSASTFSIQ